MSDEARRGDVDLGSVESWRREMLEDAGYPQEEAFLLSKRLDIDVHAACDLLSKGCSVSTAIRILT